MIPAAPPPPVSRVEIWGQPSRTAESADRPLGSTLKLFRGEKTVVLRSWHGLSLASLAQKMGAGRLMTRKGREVASLGLYLAPTTTGGVCLQGQEFQTCHRGLLREGVTYSFSYTGDVIVVFGMAADDVKRVSLGAQTTAVHENVFLLSLPMKPAAHVPKTFGTLVVSYRDGRPPARVALR